MPAAGTGTSWASNFLPMRCVWCGRLRRQQYPAHRDHEKWMQTVLELRWLPAPYPCVHFPSQQVERPMPACLLPHLSPWALGCAYSGGGNRPLTDLNEVECYAYAW